MHMLNVAMTRGAQQEGRPLPTLADWFGLLDAQTRNARAWQRLFAHYDAVIAPAWGTTAFPHDDTPITERRLDVDGEDTQFGLQLAWPGPAPFPMLPPTSVPIGKYASGLPTGVPGTAPTTRDFTPIPASTHQ